MPNFDLQIYTENSVLQTESSKNVGLNAKFEWPELVFPKEIEGPRGGKSLVDVPWNQKQGRTTFVFFDTGMY